MKDYEVFKKWLGDVMDVIYGPSHNWPFKALKKEIDTAEESNTELNRYDDVSVLFTCLESSDDENIIEKSLLEIKSSLDNLNCNRIVVYPYSHLSDNLANASKAVSLLNKFKLGLTDAGNEVNSSPFGWNKSFTISVKGHPLAEQFKIISSDSSFFIPKTSTGASIQFCSAVICGNKLNC